MWPFDYFFPEEKPEPKPEKSYEEWVQERLNAHGAKIDVDGIWGPASVRAIREFQRRKRIPISGVSDGQTHEALAKEPRKSKSPPVSAPEKPMAEWVGEMTRIMGMHEVRDNKSLISYMKIGKYLGNPKNLPWCGDALESTMVKSVGCEVPANPFLAINWRKWGQTVDAISNSVAIIQWKGNKHSGHIGYLIGIKRNAAGKITHYKLRGGNQGNSVKDSWFKASSFYRIDFRWPPGVPVERYPWIDGKAGSGGGLKGTR